MSKFAQMLGSLQGYRTVILNVAVLLMAGTGYAFADVKEIDQILLAIGTVGNIILRVYTTTPIGTKAIE